MDESHTWTLRVSSEEVGSATAYVRRHRFEVGVPLQFDEAYDQVTALEYVLGAIAADVVVGLRRLARRRRVDNPLTFLQVVGEEGHPGLVAVVLKVYVSSIDPPDRVNAVWEETLRTSPLVRTFQDSVKLELEHEVVI